MDDIAIGLSITLRLVASIKNMDLKEVESLPVIQFQIVHWTLAFERFLSYGSKQDLDRNRVFQPDLRGSQVTDF